MRKTGEGQNQETKNTETQEKSPSIQPDTENGRVKKRQTN